MSLFKKKKKEVRREVCYIIELDNKLTFLLKENKYISGKKIENLINEYQKYVEFFELLSQNLLEGYCKENNLDISVVKRVLYYYRNIKNIVEKHNDDYINGELIKEKEYLDNILKEVDPNIKLDDEQRRVVLKDEDYLQLNY